MTPSRRDRAVEDLDPPSGRYRVRHPACVPLRIREVPRPFAGPAATATHTLGGLRFSVSRPLKPGTMAEVCVQVQGEEHRFRGVVHWVRPAGRRFEMALRLTDPEQAFRARMVEQASHIEAYRQRATRTGGCPGGIEQAAASWIARYARFFAAAWERPATG